MKNTQRRAAIYILICGALIAALLLSGKFVVNVSPSVPVGLWIKADKDGDIKYGDIVKVPFSAFNHDLNDWVPERYHQKNEMGRVTPYLKRVAGLPGDIISLASYDLLAVNGKIILNSAPMSQDRIGNVLRAFKMPVKLGSGDIWLMSDSPRGFDSRYLGPADINKCEKVLPVLVF